MSKSPLARDTLLQCAPALTVSLQSGVPSTISVNGRMVDCGAHALAVLGAFARPTTLAAAVQQLGAGAVGGRDWMEMTSAIMRLHAEGVLVAADSTGVPVSASGFGQPGIHARMLEDEQRTSSYLAAIRQLIRPGDVVVEIGTGTGVLSVAAAKAGAARVYAIEATEIASAAQALITGNDVSDRVRLVRGWSTHVELPERADVLISEVIGNDPLGENVLEITADARERFLKRGARFIPRILRVFALPVQLPAEDLRKHTFQTEAAAQWSERYGIDFSALTRLEFERPGVFYVRPHVPRGWVQLAPPALLAEVDLSSVSSAILLADVEVSASAAGTISAVSVFFELDLAPGISLSTAPHSVEENSSWRVPVWILADPIRVAAGDRFTIRFQRAGGADSVSVSR